MKSNKRIQCAMKVCTTSTQTFDTGPLTSEKSTNCDIRGEIFESSDENSDEEEAMDVGDPDYKPENEMYHRSSGDEEEDQTDGQA